uniref:Glycosyl transferase family 1 domain-containing protein n=1 Tax=viral metagenome TaxID=1070528 RepID=A0A6C0JWX2_9ZZZZ
MNEVLSTSKKSIWVATFYAGQIIDPENFEGNPVFGSELALLEVFSRLGEKNDVTVFITKPVGYNVIKNNITWRSEQDWASLVSTTSPDILVISRYVGVFCDYIIPDTTKIYLWVHDIFPHPAYRGKNMAHAFVNNMSRRLSGIITVGDSQREEIIMPRYKLDRSLFTTIKNGINLVTPVKPKKNPIMSRAPMSFVYASAPDRGLVKLLKMWPRILLEWPYATLQIFHNLSDQDKQAIEKSGLERVAAMGRVNQKTLFDKLQYIDYWVYPCSFFETCCTTAIEMAFHGPICISNDLGALKENNNGIIIKNDATERIVTSNVFIPPCPNKKVDNKDVVEKKESSVTTSPTPPKPKTEAEIIDENFEEDLFEVLRRLESNPKEKEEIRKNQREWAKEQTWDARAIEWSQLLEL